MHWDSEFKNGRADKGISALIDLENAVGETQKNHWGRVQGQKKDWKILELKVSKESHALDCKCGMELEKTKGI